MEIKFKNFTMRPAQNSPHFDLVMSKAITNKETGVEKEGESLIGYDMTVERCISHITAETLKLDESVADLDTFLKAYKETIAEVFNTFKGITQ